MKRGGVATLETTFERKPKWCPCAEQVTEALRKQGHEPVLSFRLFAGETEARAVVATQRADGARARKPLTLVATFCPFCGSKYPEVSK